MKWLYIWSPTTLREFSPTRHIVIPEGPQKAADVEQTYREEEWPNWLD
jgi:hypothetical protein